MMTLLLIVYHLVLVTAVYWTAYRTGYQSCQDEARRQAKAYTAPLTEILEKLNLDAEEFLGDRRSDRDKRG